jgi:GMP synthase (glutamine-hydrolysing)
MMVMPEEKIAVLDFGGQYAHLIANRVRRLGVYAEILPPTATLPELAPFKGIIFSGGPSSVYAPDAPEFNTEILQTSLPILGICYGHQVLAWHGKGKVSPGEIKEYGISLIEHIEPEHPLLKTVENHSPMWMSHGDSVEVLPLGYRCIGKTQDCPVTVMANDELKRYGIQFHPEVTHSRCGLQLMRNFLDICGCGNSWSVETYLGTLEEAVREQTGDKKVFLLVSGGVDSTVAFVLLNKALGHDKVVGLHIDNGLMRDGESAKIMEFLKAEGMDNLYICHAEELFLRNLAGVIEPEKKRSIIGETFLEAKDKALAELNLNPEEFILAQGTIYPDTIESGGSKNADVIKTHHNRVAGILELMEQNKIIEPLADLYKDEVRLLGESLGIPHHLVWRHPFPGPGLGVRLLCHNSTPELPSAQSLVAVDEFLAKRGTSGCVLPIRSVGVQGDARTYANPLLVKDRLQWEEASVFSTRVTNHFGCINRVVMEVGSLDPTQEPLLTEQYVTKEHLDTLRYADEICNQFLIDQGIYNEVWQMPTVLLPLQIAGLPCVVIRPVNSTEAMTASFYEMKPELLDELWSLLSKSRTIGALFYDITHKPPGTIEWE